MQAEQINKISEVDLLNSAFDDLQGKLMS